MAKQAKNNNEVPKFIAILLLLTIISLFASYIGFGTYTRGIEPFHQCLGSIGYGCRSASISSSGVLNMSVIQNTSYTEYNVTLFISTYGKNISSNFTISKYVGQTVTSGQVIKINIPLKRDMFGSAHGETLFDGIARISYSMSSSNSPPDRTDKVAEILISSATT